MTITAASQKEEKSIPIPNTTTTTTNTSIPNQQDQNNHLHTIKNCIKICESTSLLLNPMHYHAFRNLSFPYTVFPTLKVCIGCHQSMIRNPFYSKKGDATRNTNNESLVKCLVCGVIAHRSCSFRNGLAPCCVYLDKIRTIRLNDDIGIDNDGDEVVVLNEDKTVITTTAEELGLDINNDFDVNHATIQKSLLVHLDEIVDSTTTTANVEDMVSTEETNTTTAENENVEEQTMHQNMSIEPKTNEQKCSVDTCKTNTINISTKNTSTVSSPPSNIFTAQQPSLQQINTNPKEQNEKELVWSEEGPPSHWAIDEPTKLNGIGMLIPSPEEEEEKEKEEEKMQVVVISQMLHENLVSYFQRVMALTNTDRNMNDDGDDLTEENKASTTVEETTTAITPTSPTINNEEKDIHSEITTDTETNTSIDLTAFLESSSPPTNQTPKISFLEGTQKTITASQRLSTLGPKLTIASIAGGLAGSVLGFACAGPVGACMAPFVGRYCSVVGVLLFEGSMIVTGFTAGFQTVQNTVPDMDKFRVLSLFHSSKNDVNDTVVMLRPNVHIDPEWNIRLTQILQTPIRKDVGIHQRASTNLQKQIAREKIESIIFMEEDEVPYEDKIFLLVSRMVTDRYSNVGRVYRGLIEFFYERIHLRDLDTAIVPDSSCVAAKVKGDHNSSEIEINRQENNNTPASTTISQEQEEDNNNNNIIIHRERRIDAHAVIHYTIQTLFESKPNLKQSNNPNSNSSIVSTLSMNAIEELVLGELYTSLQQEIRLEMYQKDNALSSTIHLFLEDVSASLIRKEEEDREMIYPKSISIQALESIRALPEARSAGTKLNHCMQFIEYISLSYSKQQNSSTTTPQTNVTTLMCTDSLLTLVCQHIIYAQIPFLNADIAFIEEFIRDEQLLKGIEGYVLVTLQASLSYMNGCSLMNLKDLFL